MKRALVTTLITLVLGGPAAWVQGAAGQELEPRSFVNTPVGLNFLIASYGYTDGNVVFSAASPIEDAEVQTHIGILAYLQSFSLAGLSAKYGIVVPHAWTSGTAEVAGQPREREVSGFADPRFRLSVNLLGAPAVSLKELASYQQDLIVGASLEVAAPLGQYDPSKLLNIGTNRWSIRSELGASKAIGLVTFETSVAATFFTTNDDFLGGMTLEQDPLYSAQTHLIYQFQAGPWAAFDATYYIGGRTAINGEQGETQENARLGLTLSLPVSRHNSIKIYGSTGIYSRTESNFDALGIAWQVRWGGGL